MEAAMAVATLGKPVIESKAVSVSHIISHLNWAKCCRNMQVAVAVKTLLDASCFAKTLWCWRRPNNLSLKKHVKVFCFFVFFSVGTKTPTWNCVLVEPQALMCFYICQCKAVSLQLGYNKITQWMFFLFFGLLLAAYLPFGFVLYTFFFFSLHKKTSSVLLFTLVFVDFQAHAALCKGVAPAAGNTRKTCCWKVWGELWQSVSISLVLFIFRGENHSKWLFS